jgi:hypothetical protein
MRTLSLFALALGGLAVLTVDASAFGRKNRGGGNCCGSAGGYAGYASPCGNPGGCGGYSGYASPGYYGGYHGHVYGATSTCCGGSAAYANPGLSGIMPQATAGGQNVIQATDGTVYYRGTDGSYYTSPQGMAGQPYYGNYPGGMYNHGYSNYPGIYQAGYPGTHFGPGIIQTGGIPLQMPVPIPMPRR